MYIESTFIYKGFLSQYQVMEYWDRLRKREIKITQSESGHKRNPEADSKILSRLILTFISPRESCYTVESLSLTFRHNRRRRLEEDW